MYVDSLGSTGITTDSRKVRPGMIYIDLSSRRNRKEIYKAYMNGASLIFTHQNISDPDLPVVKVENPHDTLSMILQHSLNSFGRQSKLIGLIGNGDKRIMLDLIESILLNKTKSKDDSKTDGNNILERLTSIQSEETDLVPVSLDTSPRNLYYYNNLRFDFVIINDIGVLEYSQDSTNKIKVVNEFLANVLRSNTILINNDEPFSIKAVDLSKEVIPITYGLNKRAAVTASSIDMGDTTYFNYCLQRSFRTKSGRLVEPFEMPIALNTMGNHIIYNALAAVTCGLYYDVDINRIRSIIERYRVPERHFEKIYSGSFTVIDNYCSSPLDFKAALESLQILSYENLYLIISITGDDGIHADMEKAALISEWARILKCKKVLLTGCMDQNMDIQGFPIRNIRVFKKIFKDRDVSFSYYHQLRHAAEFVHRNIRKGDLLVLLGGDEMNRNTGIFKNDNTIMH